MANIQAAESDGPITSINVTPLVDILLVLLIIFMATAPLIHKRAINVSVPKAATGAPEATDALEIVYNAKKQILVSGKVVSLDQLSRQLAWAVKDQPELHVTLSADKSLGYGDVMELLDAARGAGVRRLGLEVVRK